VNTILPVLSSLNCKLSKTSQRRLSRIVEALLASSGRITQFGLSRYGGKGCSRQSIRRFFQTQIDWNELLIQLFHKYLFDPEEEYMLAGDETVVSKSGKKTHGVDLFYSSIAKRPISSFAAFGIALVGMKCEEAFVIHVQQSIRSEEEKQEAKERAEEKKKKENEENDRRSKRSPGQSRTS
jgi:putative transposase